MARTPIHPGEILSQELEETGLSAKKLADVIDVPRLLMCAPKPMPPRWYSLSLPLIPPLTSMGAVDRSVRIHHTPAPLV
jgi:hypothetical protein